MVRLCWLLPLLITALSSVASAQTADSAGLDFFETKVRPLLAERCYKCHSNTSEKLKGGLHLDSPLSISAGGESGTILKAGEPDQSRIIIAVRYETPDLQMPPKRKLSATEIATLTQWVKMGAPMPKPAAGAAVASADAKIFDLQKRKASHWCWQPIRPVEPPPVTNGAWPAGAIDRFILAKLEAKGLSPAQQTDKRSLIRRAYFDLIGLPPKPEEVDAFVNDASPEAFTKVVDRLLASEHFGERWARHWLDLVRYGQSYGHESDFPLDNAEPYVHYLVRAFNADLPFNQFVSEQIAGDLLPTPRMNAARGFNESIIGSGFWYFGEQTHSPVDVRQQQADRIDNQIEVFSKTFLGLTVNCARCHDHKFDAISTKDYYALFGIVESTRLQHAYLDPGGAIASAAAKLAAARDVNQALVRSKLPSSKDAGERLTHYLLAAHEVMASPATVAGAGKKSDDILFEDFEKPTYDGWQVEGTAFGDGPQTRKTIGAYQGDVGAVGNGFVNSHNIRHSEDVTAGDRHTGKLTSRPFKIERRLIRFLIGGGAHEGRTCLNVTIDGKVVRTAIGRSENHMLPAEIDVADLRGKTARIEIIDAEQGPWGNIGVDQIVFSDGGSEISKPVNVEQVAKQHNIDAKVLARVVDALANDKASQSPTHPMFAWRTLSSAKDEKDFAPARGKLAAEVKSADAANGKSLVFEAFNSDSFANWFPAGEAFGSGPTRKASLASRARSLTFGLSGVADSGAIDARLRGVLRSKSFVIEQPHIYYRLAGSKAKIRLIVDGYCMDIFTPLLFEGMNFDVNTDPASFQWHDQNVSKFVGHRANIELIDDGEGWIAVDEIRFGDGGAPPASPAVDAGVLSESVVNVSLLAEGYGHLLTDALSDDSAKQPRGGNELINWAIAAGILIGADELRAVNDAIARTTQEAGKIPVLGPMRAIAASDGNGVDERIFLRGNHKTPGEIVHRRFLEAIAGADQPALPGGSSGRLELARFVTDPSNPLPSRVIVNRVWHHLLGRGIVPTTDDFGVMGQPPTHPELLDYLAGNFVKDHGSIKLLIRSIMLSRTYQLSSVPSERAMQVDANNELLQHARIRRLEGEAIRDSILAVSGRLDPHVEGPFVDVNLTSFMEGRGKPPTSGPLDGAGRRSIYLRIRRNFLSPMMLAFDFPIPFSTNGRRTVSNVPAQALILLNDPFVLEQCKLIAQRTLDEKNLTPQQRITKMYESAFARPPSDEELSAAMEFLQQQGKELGVPHDQIDRDVRPWTDLAHVLVNVKKFIFLN